MSRGPVPDFPEARPSVPEVADRIRAYYELPGNSVGGSLHTVLDDGNIEPSSVEWCVQRAEERGDGEGAEIGRLLLAMTPTQRRRLAAMHFYPARPR